MSIVIYSHANAEEILRQRGGGRAFEELREVTLGLPVIRHAGKSENASLLYLQTCMNRILDYVLPDYGWRRQVRMPGGFVANNVDFYKFFAVDLRVWLEVEFGNMARSDSDTAKLRHAIDRELSDVNVIILPVTSLANKMDQSVATFERVVRALMSDQGHQNKPHLVIGIEEDPMVTLDIADWGLPLEELKSGSYSAAKEEVYRRAWHEHMLPGLPANSWYHVHQREVAQTDINYSQFHPAFPDFIDEVLEVPVIKRYGADGSVAPADGFRFYQQKKRKRKRRSKFPQGFKRKLTAVKNRRKPVRGFLCADQRQRVYAQVRCARPRAAEKVVEPVSQAVRGGQSEALLRDLYRQALSGEIDLPESMLACIEMALSETEASTFGSCFGG